MLDKGLRTTTTKRDGEIGKQTEIGTLNMK